MRYLVILIFGISFLASCANSANEKAAVTTAPTQTGVTPTGDTANFTSIEWAEPVKSYGKIVEGQKLEVTFAFKNTGDKPLVIYSVKPSCGCTAAEPPKEPIAPGETGEIKGTFDSNGKVGSQHKSMFVTANTKGKTDHELVFEVEVGKKPGEKQ
jgi:Protein of unknown function (DUF1573)